MTPERARQLLGGLAAGILTPEERETLFEAALHDQALFNEVADEMELALFLQSPETRAQLANRIEVEPETRRWWELGPGWLALSGVVAASAVLFVVLWPRHDRVASRFVPATPVAVESGPSASGSTSSQTTAMTAPARAERVEDAKRKAALVNKKSTIADETAKDLEAKSPVRDQGRPEQAKTQPAAAAPQEFATLNEAPAPPAATGKPAAPLVAPTVAPPDSIRPGSPATAATPRANVASLSGMVHDARGAPIAGATVDIVNRTTNTTTRTEADANGRFAAPSLPEGGPYTVIAAAPGFKKEERVVNLAVNQPVRVDVPMQTGSIAEAAAVNAQAPMAASSQANSGQNQTQVAVLDFANSKGQSQSGAQVADLLSDQLLNGGQVRVIDREKVQQAAQSQAQGGRAPSAQEAAALGRSIGADAVILGSVQAPTAGSGDAAGIGGFAQQKPASDNKVRVTAEVIDTRQAKPPVKMTAAGASIQGAANSLGNQIQSRLAQSWEGKVTSRTGDLVSIEFAEPPGLKIGARCEVIRGTQKVGELVITSLDGRSAFGKFTGRGRPRAGDRVTASR